MTIDTSTTTETEETSYFLSITERDIDLLMLEEFHSNREFTSWFASQCLPSIQQIEFCGAWHSLVDSVYGESDLTLVIDADEEKTAILIEDKIDATTMPEQADRYRRRGEKGIADGQWKRFFTCMIAPQKYLNHLPEGERYDSYISYEDIAAWFQLTENRALCSERGQYRAHFITSAIDKQRRTGAAPRDPLVEMFFNRYVEYACQQYPELPSVMPNWNWATFKLIPISPSTIGVSLHHKLTQGIVELEFQCEPEHHEALIRKFSTLQKYGRIFKKYTKYFGIRMETRRLDVGNDFDNVVEDVNDALSKADALIKDFKEIYSGSGPIL